MTNIKIQRLAGRECLWELGYGAVSLVRAARFHLNQVTAPSLMCVGFPARVAVKKTGLSKNNLPTDDISLLSDLRNLALIVLSLVGGPDHLVHSIPTYSLSQQFVSIAFTKPTNTSG